jgi:hypothetical protein
MCTCAKKETKEDIMLYIHIEHEKKGKATYVEQTKKKENVIGVE